MLQGLWSWFALDSRLSDVYTLRFSLMISYSSLYDDVLYILLAVHSSAQFVSQLKTVGQLILLRAEYRRKGPTRSERRKRNMPLVDMVAIVAEVYGAVCQLYSRLWNTTLVT